MKRHARLAAALALWVPALSWAGAQQYEPLAASVRTSMHSAIADRASPHLAFDSPDEGSQWLQDMSLRLTKRIPDEQARQDLLTTVHYESKRAGLDPQLVLGVIEVESKFRKYAVSHAGARGYMQVMPFWVELLGSNDHNLFALRTNLRYGCVILRHYIDVERGDLTRALARYNGSLGNADYAKRVVQVWRTRWAWPATAVQRASHSTRPTRYMGDAN
jgi:soluble lytic murein transglycosylase-like protein